VNRTGEILRKAFLAMGRANVRCGGGDGLSGLPDARKPAAFRARRRNSRTVKLRIAG